ncbi:hypothetical protein [Terriglobus aquaticus]|uniref:Uncharacterized protein n=1 Tax=Terriglobus aquaticus TaxID=940139 RepID=A0ABW9KHC9_9BACT|nr:hypothetical protein [Terriglobus aquaticus]
MAYALTTSGDKRLNEMNRLGDMLHFPAAVNAGATLNVLLTVAATWYVEPRYPSLGGVWVALVLLVNLTPVFLLRLTLRPETLYPMLREMNFFTDQHKFSDWVYVAASADMAFWILLAWTLSALHRDTSTLVLLECVALLATFSPVILRSVGLVRS